MKSLYCLKQKKRKFPEAGHTSSAIRLCVAFEAFNNKQANYFIIHPRTCNRFYIFMYSNFPREVGIMNFNWGKKLSSLNSKQNECALTVSFMKHTYISLAVVSKIKREQDENLSAYKM